jgi:hypothetical protein
MCRVESFLDARVNDLFLYQYLEAPLRDMVCGLVIHVSMVLDFKYVVWGVKRFTRRHIGVRVVCRFLFFLLCLYSS